MVIEWKYKMLNEDIKNQLKNEDLSKLDIHNLAVNLRLNNISIDFNEKYINEMVDYIVKNTKLEHTTILEENGRPALLRIMSSLNSRNQLMISNSNSSLEISIYGKLKTIVENEDYIYNTKKTLIIYKNPRNILDIFIFKYTITGKIDEREYLSYYFTSLTKDKRNNGKKEHNIYSDVTAGEMLPIISEIMINKEIKKDFFEVLELTQDLKNNVFEILFDPLLNIESKNEHLKDFLTDKITIKNTMVKK